MRATCRTCGRPITLENGVWVDDLPRDRQVCFSAINYRHVPRESVRDCHAD